MTEAKIPLYAAYGRPPGGELRHVTLGGFLFFANKGLLEWMVKLMQAKHSTAEFEIREVVENVGV